MKHFRLVALAALLAFSPALAQYQTPNHSVPIGRGSTVQGFGKATPAAAGIPLISGGATADPVFGTATVPGGGTGLATLTAGAILYGNGVSPVGQAVVTGLVLGNGASPPTAYGGGSCTNQFFGAISALGAPTCVSPVLTSAQFANQGTATTLLHGNAAGNPTWGPVSLTADVTSTLPVANGGTGASSFTANAFLTGNGTSAINQVAITGLVVGNGASAPTAYAGGGCGSNYIISLSAIGGITCGSFGTGVFTALGNAVNAAGGVVTVANNNQVTRGMEAQGAARSVVGVTGNATANVADIQGTANQFLGVNAAGTALAFQTMGGDATLSGPSITVTKTGGVAFGGYATISAGALTNSLAGNAALNSTTFVDGPTVAQGSTGTWFASGHVTLADTAVGGSFICKLHDGTTVIDSASATGAGVSQNLQVALSGQKASPAGNLRISCKDASTSTGLMLSNSSGLSMDSTITAFRVN